MKAIDKLRNHMKFMCDHGLMRMEMDTVNTHLDEIERELEECYIEAPVDADGVPIHLCDRLKVDGGTGVYVVGNMTCCTDGWLIGTEWGQIGRPEEDAHHYEPPTVEDVLREFVFEACGDSTPEEAVVKRFAERLQLREGE